MIIDGFYIYNYVKPLYPNWIEPIIIFTFIIGIIFLIIKKIKMDDD